MGHALDDVANGLGGFLLALLRLLLMTEVGNYVVGAIVLGVVCLSSSRI